MIVIFGVVKGSWVGSVAGGGDISVGGISFGWKFYAHLSWVFCF